MLYISITEAHRGHNQSLHYFHLVHCLDRFRQEIICHADDVRCSPSPDINRSRLVNFCFVDTSQRSEEEEGFGRKRIDRPNASVQGLVRPHYLGPRAQRLLHRPFLQASSEVGQLQELPCRLTVPAEGARALQPLGQLASRFQQDRLAASPRMARRSRGIDHISRGKIAVRKGCPAAVNEEDHGAGRWLLFPPVQFARISARNGDQKREIVVMIRGFSGDGSEWQELFSLRTEDEQAGLGIHSLMLRAKALCGIVIC